MGAVIAQKAKQGRARRLAEPPGVPDQVVIGQVGVGRRDRHAGEVVRFGQRVLDVHDGQHQRQRDGFGLGQRPDRLVTVQEHRGGGQVGAGRGDLRQVKPAHHGALEGQGQVVHCEGPVGQAEVEDPGHLRVGSGRGPGEVGRVPVAVRPLRGQRGQLRRGPADQRDQDLAEVLLPAAFREVGGERGARGHQRARRVQRVRRGDDLAGIHQRGGGPGGPPEVRGGQVQAGQRHARRVRVSQAGVRRPADRVAVQVDAVGGLVYLVAEVPAPQHGTPVRQPHHGRDRQPPRAQVSGELVLGRELLRGADADVVTLDEDRDVSVPDQRGGRHRPRAAPDDHGLAAEPARVAPA